MTGRNGSRPDGERAELEAQAQAYLDRWAKRFVRLFFFMLLFTWGTHLLRGTRWW